MKKWMLLRAAKFVALTIVMASILGFVFMELWNILIPDIFNGPTITFLQSIGLLVLSHILVRLPGSHFHNDWKNHRWKHKMDEKLLAMTPEEREKFKEEWRRRCGWTPKEFDEKEKRVRRWTGARLEDRCLNFRENWFTVVLT